MENLDYLIGLALVQQNEQRIMPIGGKSIKVSIPIDQLLILVLIIIISI